MSFSRYTEDDIAYSNREIVRGLWSGDLSEITTFYKNSVNPDYYHTVYKDNILVNDQAKPQFEVQYGNINGSGSVNLNPGVNGITASRIVYGQYRNQIYGTETQNFKFANSLFTGDVNDIFIININRSRYKESLNPGSLKLVLKNGSNTISLTDNSKDTPTSKYIESNRYFDLVSGSAGKNESVIINPNGSYGYVFPDLGIIIINPNALAATPANGGISFNVNNYASNRHGELFNLISNGGSFTLQSIETVSSVFFFTRLRNKEFNYTTNPSFIDDNGNILYKSLVYDPQTFVTTIGLYNDSGELLAVAKLSKPLSKSFVNELNLRVKLDF